MNIPLKTLFATVLLCSATFAYAESETLREDLQPTLLASASGGASIEAHAASVA